MSGLKTGAYTGSAKEGNPYTGDMDKGMAYDAYESSVKVIDSSGDTPFVTTTYRAIARKLVQSLPANVKSSQHILAIGSGTGIDTLEVFVQNRASTVTGIEQSEGMQQLARYKFNQAKGNDQISSNPNKTLQNYWNAFRAESAPYQDRVSFVVGDFLKIQPSDVLPVDAAVANQVVHWMDMPSLFSHMNGFLQPGGNFLWNTASHFYDDPQFPVKQYGFRYNDFLKYVLEEVSKKVDVGDYFSLAQPPHTLESVLEVTRRSGFATEHVSTNMTLIDLQTYIANHVPVFVKKLIKEPIEEDEANSLIRDALAKTINNPNAFKDTEHKYEFVPLFRSMKTN